MRTILGLFALGGAGLFGTTMLHYGYTLMAELALLLVLVVAAWIVLNIVIIMSCGNSENAALRQFGETWGAIFKYTALGQAVIYTVMVLWPIAVLFGWDDLPANKAEFLYEFAVGAGYLSAFIMGGAGLSAAATARRGATRWMGVAFGLAGIAVPLLPLLLMADSLQVFITQREGAFALVTVAYLLLASVLGMWIVLKSGAEMAANPPRGRLPG